MGTEVHHGLEGSLTSGGDLSKALLLLCGLESRGQAEVGRERRPPREGGWWEGPNRGIWRQAWAYKVLVNDTVVPTCHV